MTLCNCCHLLISIGPMAVLLADSVTSSVNNVFVRKGAIIGVFFEPNIPSLPVIGTVSTNYTVCKLTGTLTETTMINCTSANMISNLIIDAEMDIGNITCFWLVQSCFQKLSSLPFFCRYHCM